jgi:hypothetical protein
VVGASASTRVIFLDLGVVIVETASPSDLCEEVCGRLAEFARDVYRAHAKGRQNSCNITAWL